MENIKLCPNCSSISAKVENITVKSILLGKYKNQVIENEHWYICTGSNCEIIYFTEEGKTYSKHDVKVKVWYKETADDVPVCYCSNLTRGEIINAMNNGCKTVKEIRKYTNKNITGNCRIENPLGKCCKNAFISVMNNYNTDTD